MPIEQLFLSQRMFKGDMNEEELEFIGILSNADPSISRLKLGHGFRLEQRGFDEICQLLSQRCQISRDGVIERFISSGIGQEFCVVTKTYVSDPLMSDAHSRYKNFSDFLTNEIKGYLAGQLSSMRLFKEGNIQMPLEFICAIVDDRPSTIYENTRGYSNRLGGKYSLTEKEVHEFQEFNRRVKIPFSEPYLRMAFESFEQSYFTSDLYGNHNLVFLSLMISLETLLNPGPQELRYRISRNAAVLLGEGKERCKELFKDLGRLYDIRSEIVHNGRIDLVSEGDVLRLRDYVRNAITRAYEMHMDKASLVDELNSRGFEPLTSQ